MEAWSRVAFTRPAAPKTARDLSGTSCPLLQKEGTVLGSGDGGYLPARYAVHCAFMRELWPLVNVYMHASSV